MDTLTHLITGAAIGEAIMGRRIGKSAMLWGALAANAPDVDALTGFFVGDLDALLLHRGITHSVFVALLAGAGLGWIFSRLYGKQSGHMLPWILLFTTNWLFHEFLDTATMYGTSLMLPFIFSPYLRFFP